jgi:hypothetical protein
MSRRNIDPKREFESLKKEVRSTVISKTIAAQAGSVTSVAAGTNLSASTNPIVASGTINVSVTKSGATQVAASAAAGELWYTASHATLPDNVVMIGV